MRFMFHVFIDTKNNEELVNLFVECFTSNCQCIIDKYSAKLFIEIDNSINNNTYVYTNTGLFTILSNENRTRRVPVAITSILPEYVDKSITEKLDALSCPSIVVLGGKNKTNYKSIVEFVCFCIFKYFHIDSLLEPMSFKDLDTIGDPNKVIEKNFSIGTDSNGNKIYSKIKDRDTVDSTTVERASGSLMFRVRKRFTDYGSEKLATRDLQRAVTECNKHTGYHVYDNDGKVIYESNKNRIVVNSNRSTTLPNETARIRTGNGIRLKSESGEFIHISDGEIVQISKRIGNETEILVTRNGEQYKTFVNSDVLATF